jgi:hypothetical protein
MGISMGISMFMRIAARPLSSEQIMVITGIPYFPPP